MMIDQLPQSAIPFQVTHWRGVAVMAEDWGKLAECRKLDPELFFPISETDPGIAHAKAACERCRVSGECLSEAAGDPDAWKWGIRGGLTEWERERLDRKEREALRLDKVSA